MDYINYSNCNSFWNENNTHGLLQDKAFQEQQEFQEKLKKSETKYKTEHKNINKMKPKSSDVHT